jgi:hypothetical protein
MDDAPEHGPLNSSQRLRLLSSCQYADKLLSEIEATLAASQSKSPFPKFQPDISAAQAKVVQDYIARMRAQLVRILDSQRVPIPAPLIGSVHAIRVTLGFVDIAFDECRPKRMAGYGDLADTAAVEIAVFGRVSSGKSSLLRMRLQRSASAGQPGQGWISPSCGIWKRSSEPPPVKFPRRGRRASIAPTPSANAPMA